MANDTVVGKGTVGGPIMSSSSSKGMRRSTVSPSSSSSSPWGHLFGRLFGRSTGVASTSSHGHLFAVSGGKVASPYPSSSIGARRSRVLPCIILVQCLFLVFFAGWYSSTIRHQANLLPSVIYSSSVAHEDHRQGVVFLGEKSRFMEAKGEEKGDGIITTRSEPRDMDEEHGNNSKTTMRQSAAIESTGTPSSSSSRLLCGRDGRRRRRRPRANDIKIELDIHRLLREQVGTSIDKETTWSVCKVPHLSERSALRDTYHGLFVQSDSSTYPWPPLTNERLSFPSDDAAKEVVVAGGGRGGEKGVRSGAGLQQQHQQQLLKTRKYTTMNKYLFSLLNEHMNYTCTETPYGCYTLDGPSHRAVIFDGRAMKKMINSGFQCQWPGGEFTKLHILPTFQMGIMYCELPKQYVARGVKEDGNKEEGKAEEERRRADQCCGSDGSASSSSQSLLEPLMATGASVWSFTNLGGRCVTVTTGKPSDPGHRFCEPFVLFPPAEGQRFRLSLCMKTRDQSIHLKEWLVYHILHGVEHFFVYDNESKEELFLVLRPFVALGLVTYVWWPDPGRRRHQTANADCMYRFRQHMKGGWTGFIDVDEFVVAGAGTGLGAASIVEGVDAADRGAGAIPFSRVRNAEGVDKVVAPQEDENEEEKPAAAAAVGALYNSSAPATVSSGPTYDPSLFRRVLEKYGGDADVFAVYLPYALFGHSNRLKRPERLVIESYTDRRPLITTEATYSSVRKETLRNGKSFVKADRMLVPENAHIFLPTAGVTVALNGNESRLNHYRMKSFEDYMEQSKWIFKKTTTEYRDYWQAMGNEYSGEKDEFIVQFAPRVRQMIDMIHDLNDSITLELSRWASESPDRSEEAEQQALTAAAAVPASPLGEVGQGEGTNARTPFYTICPDR